MDTVLADYRDSSIPHAEQELFAFVEKINADAEATRQPDIEILYAHGWTDEAILDAILVCSLFNFYNTLVDATGCPALSDLGHAASGKRIATAGYRER